MGTSEHLGINAHRVIAKRVAGRRSTPNRGRRRHASRGGDQYAAVEPRPKKGVPMLPMMMPAMAMMASVPAAGLYEPRRADEPSEYGQDY
jgi:hypothetical protein